MANTGRFLYELALKYPLVRIPLGLFWAATFALFMPKFFEGYQAEIKLKEYTPEQRTVKLSQTLEASIEYSKKETRYTYTPCLTVKIATLPYNIKACKKEGYTNSYEKTALEFAEHYLKKHFPNNENFTIYVNPDKTKAYLDGYKAEDEWRWIIAILIISSIALSVFSYFVFIEQVDKLFRGIEE